jgi:hypothetical protein
VDSSNPKGTPYFTAVKTEPNGQTFLVPTEEVPQYEALVCSIFAQYQPNTFTEKLAAQAVVNYTWRLRRVAQLEAGMYALGRYNFAGKHSHETDPAKQESLIKEETEEKYAKEFKNLAKQKKFLTRLLKTETAELNRMLKENPKRRGLFLVPKGKVN